MKTPNHLSRITVLLSISGFQLFSFSAFPQGSLTPPGAPAPTMKSLDQIEARTPISTAPYNISAPGSYYLTGNLTVSSGSAITINAGGVTLDLNGFTISSTASSPGAAAILIGGGLSKITILNGSIEGGATVSGSTWSGGNFSDGITFTGSVPKNVRITGLTINGFVGSGIYISSDHSSVVESCIVQAAGVNGIRAPVVRNSTAVICGLNGIVADEVSDSFGSAIASGGNGISGTYSVINCGGSSSNSYGIVVSPGVVENSYGESSTGTGISGYAVQNCNAVSNAGTALNGVTITNCYASNNSATNATITGTSVQSSYAVQAGSGRCIDAGDVADSAASSQFSGTTSAILIFAKNVSNTYVEALSASGATGIDADVVQNSWATVTGNGSLGIAAQVSGLNCFGKVTAGNGGAILGTQLNNCYGASVSGLAILGQNLMNCSGTSGPGGTGLAGNGAAPNISHCTAWMGNGGTGIDVSANAVVEDCVVVSATTAITVGSNCLIKGNDLNENSNGVVVSGTSNRIEANNGSCVAPGAAYVLNGTHNLIIANSARDNGNNQYVLNASPNSYGTITNVSSGGVITTSDPRANLVY